MLAQVPYLLPVLAGFIAGCSAVLLRRAAHVMGEWLVWLSTFASLASAAAFLAGFIWAAQTAAAPALVDSPRAGPSPITPSSAQAVVGLALTLAGSILLGWSLRVRGLGTQRMWDASRFEQQRPYRVIRRPLELGGMACVFGLCWLRPIPPVWICLAAWIALWNVMLELGDWELRRRLPACRDYLKRTPRYVPRFVRQRKATSPIAGDE